MNNEIKFKSSAWFIFISFVIVILTATVLKIDYRSTVKLFVLTFPVILVINYILNKFLNFIKKYEIIDYIVDWFMFLILIIGTILTVIFIIINKIKGEVFLNDNTILTFLIIFIVFKSQNLRKSKSFDNLSYIINAIVIQSAILCLSIYDLEVVKIFLKIY